MTPLRFLRLVTADQYRAAELRRCVWWQMWRKWTLRWGFFALESRVRRRIDLRATISARRELALGTLHYRNTFTILPPARNRNAWSD